MIFNWSCMNSGDRCYEILFIIDDQYWLLHHIIHDQWWSCYEKLLIIDDQYWSMGHIMTLSLGIRCPNGYGSWVFWVPAQALNACWRLFSITLCVLSLVGSVCCRFSVDNPIFERRWWLTGVLPLRSQSPQLPWQPAVPFRIRSVKIPSKSSS